MEEIENKRTVLIEAASASGSLPHRLLDLQHILTPELRPLSPTESEIIDARVDPATAMVTYADRIRQDYRANAGGIREGFRLLSDSLASGRSISISCSCRGDAACHSDIVKMAIEKVHGQFERSSGTARSQYPVDHDRPARRDAGQSVPRRENFSSNPRTARAIAEIMGESRTDRLLGSINRTEGRSRSEHASFLGRSSQFVRDLYEQGATSIDGSLLVPSEGAEVSRPVRVASLEYAFNKLGRLVTDETRARELAPLIVEYGNKIAGSGADGETRVKVFGAIYSALEGRSEFLSDIDRLDANESKDERVLRNLEEIRRLAEQMFLLEPAEIRTPSLIAEMDRSGQTMDDSRDIQDLGGIHDFEPGHPGPDHVADRGQSSFSREAAYEKEYGSSAAAPGFERIELPGDGFPRIPAGIEGFELKKLLESTLPELDRQLENGTPVPLILKPYRDRVRRSLRDDALNKLESIFRRAKIRELEERLAGGEVTAKKRGEIMAEAAGWKAARLTPTHEQIREALLESEETGRLERSSGASAARSPGAAARLIELLDRAEERRQAEGVKTVSQMSEDGRDADQPEKLSGETIDRSKRIVISLSSPAEFHPALRAAEDQFYKQKKLDIAVVRAEIADLRSESDKPGNDRLINKLRRDLGEMQEKTFSPSFRLEKSARIVTGEPSAAALEELEFASKYLKYQLRQPGSRLRHENERYRAYASRLENSRDIGELVTAASSIRAENARAGLERNSITSNGRAEPPPLSANEMQFLFTETSPQHYTREMTATRLSFAHAGASRRAMVEALKRGEIEPGPDARKLIDSLGSRLNRKELTDAIAATKHFLESIRTADAELRYKNQYDHRELFQRLPPPEKDLVYFRAVQQKENLEYKLALREQVPVPAGGSGKELREASAAETSFLLLGKFNQAVLLGERLGTVGPDSPEVTHIEFAAAAIVLNNNSADQTKMIAGELIAAGDTTRKMGEILTTFASARTENFKDRTVIEITLPADRRLSVDIYRELLERFYPDDPRENDRFKMTGFSLGLIEDTHVRGRDMVLENWRARLEQKSPDGNVPAPELSVHGEALRDLQAIMELQQAARGAVKLNNALIAKYVARAAAIISREQKVLPSPIEQRAIAVAAIGGSIEGVETSVPASERFLKAIQDHVSITDFRRFSENQRDIDEKVREIRDRMDVLSRSGILWEKGEGPKDRPGPKLPADVHLNGYSDQGHGSASAERLAILKAGVKSDLINALQRSGSEIGPDLIGDTKQILSRNFTSSGIANGARGEHMAFEHIGREIAERIGVLAANDKHVRYAPETKRRTGNDPSRGSVPRGSQINSEYEDPMRSADRLR